MNRFVRFFFHSMHWDVVNYVVVCDPVCDPLCDDGCAVDEVEAVGLLFC